MARINSVNRILFRRSLTLNMFHRLDSTFLSPLQSGATPKCVLRLVSRVESASLAARPGFGELALSATPQRHNMVAVGGRGRQMDARAVIRRCANGWRTGCPWPVGDGRPTAW